MNSDEKKNPKKTTAIWLQDCYLYISWEFKKCQIKVYLSKKK